MIVLMQKDTKARFFSPLLQMEFLLRILTRFYFLMSFPDRESTFEDFYCVHGLEAHK